MDEPHGDTAAVPERLRRRADFLRVAKGKRFHGRGLTLQAAQSGDPQGSRASGQTAACCETPPRFGFTVTKKAGSAVRRNRIRRRLKEALRLLKPLPAQPGHDYVILARPESLGMSFRSLQAELAHALVKIENRKNSTPIHPLQGHDRPGSNMARETRGKAKKGRTPKG